MLPKYQGIIQTYNSPIKTNLYQSLSEASNILDILLRCGLPASIKYLLQKQGIAAGTVRRPLLPLSKEYESELDKMYNTYFI